MKLTFKELAKWIEAQKSQARIDLNKSNDRAEHWEAVGRYDALIGIEQFLRERGRIA